MSGRGQAAWEKAFYLAVVADEYEAILALPRPQDRVDLAPRFEAARVFVEAARVRTRRRHLAALVCRNAEYQEDSEAPCAPFRGGVLGQSDPSGEPPRDACYNSSNVLEEAAGTSDSVERPEEGGRADRARSEGRGRGSPDEAQDTETGTFRSGLAFAPYSLVSLASLIDKYCRYITSYVVQIRKFERTLKKSVPLVPAPSNTHISPTELASLRSGLSFEYAAQWFEALELRHSLDYLIDLQKHKLNSVVPYADAAAMMTQLADRIMSELKECWHIYIPREDVAGYRDPFSVWRSTKEAFPSAAFDAQESVRCMAAGRFTAAVFHAMRILEVGIGCLAIKLGVPVKRQDKSWSSVLAAIRDEIDEKYPSKGLTTAKKARRRKYLADDHAFPGLRKGMA